MEVRAASVGGVDSTSGPARAGAVSTAAARDGEAPGAAASATAGETALHLFAEQVRRSGPRVALRNKRDGRWLETTWSDWDRIAREVAAGLAAAGVAKGDRVCVLAQTRVEWAFADVGILMAGAVTVPIYHSNTPKECAFIVRDSGARAILVDDPTQLAKLFDPAVRGEVLAQEPAILVIDEHVRIERPQAPAGDVGGRELSVADVVPEADRRRVRTLSQLRESGTKWMADHPGELDARTAGLTPGDLFTIVYTSGTTGNPKGVVLTHRNITSECRAIREAMPLGPSDHQLLFLPMAHVFAKVTLWAVISVGSIVSFAESLAKIKENLLETHPTFFSAVPRVYEKFYAGLQQAVAEQPALRRALMSWAIRTGTAAARAQREGRRIGPALALQRLLADRLVLGTLRAKLGLERVRFTISGAAPLAADIAGFFHGLGILVLEGYGLTETTAGSTLNRPDRYRFGTVGPALPGVELKIASDGEILIRGPHILLEYWGRPDDTREALEPDGWFHSGDVGEIQDGFLRITDRKKDLIVTSGGKKVAPQILENQLKTSSPIISQVMVHGDQRKFISALVTIAEDNLAKWAAQQGLSGSYATLVGGPEVRRAIQAAVDGLNRHLASYEQIKKFAILPSDFSQETGELTPTLKVKRKITTEKYRSILDAFYAEG